MYNSEYRHKRQKLISWIFYIFKEKRATLKQISQVSILDIGNLSSRNNWYSISCGEFVMLPIIGNLRVILALRDQ